MVTANIVKLLDLKTIIHLASVGNPACHALEGVVDQGVKFLRYSVVPQYLPLGPVVSLNCPVCSYHVSLSLRRQMF